VLHSGTYPQTLDYAGKACQGQTLKLIMKRITYGRKQFYNIGPYRALPIGLARVFVYV
jgi:hypothetical protein